MYIVGWIYVYPLASLPLLGSNSIKPSLCHCLCFWPTTNVSQQSLSPIRGYRLAGIVIIVADVVVIHAAVVVVAVIEFISFYYGLIQTSGQIHSFSVKVCNRPGSLGKRPICSLVHSFIQMRMWIGLNWAELNWTELWWAPRLGSLSFPRKWNIQNIYVHCFVGVAVAFRVHAFEFMTSWGIWQV